MSEGSVSQTRMLGIQWDGDRWSTAATPKGISRKEEKNKKRTEVKGYPHRKLPATIRDHRKSVTFSNCRNNERNNWWCKLGGSWVKPFSKSLINVWQSSRYIRELRRQPSTSYKAMCEEWNVSCVDNPEDMYWSESERGTSLFLITVTFCLLNYRTKSEWWAAGSFLKFMS